MRDRFRLALALFRTSATRSLATILGVAAAVGLVGAVDLVSNAFTSSADDQLTAVFTHYDAIVSSPVDAPISPAALDSLQSMNEVDEAVPLSQHEARIEGRPVLLLALPVDDAPATPLADHSTGDLPVTMSRSLQQELGLSPGSRTSATTGAGVIPISITGAPTEPGQHQFDTGSYVVTASSALATFEGATSLAAPNLVLIRLHDASNLDALATHVEQLGSLRVQDREQARRSLVAGLSSLLDTLPLVGLIALLLGAVLVFAVIRASTITQRPDLILLRAIGATSRQLTRLAVTSAVGHSAVGVLLGLVLCHPLAESLFKAVPASVRNSSAQVLSIDYTLPVLLGIPLAVLTVSGVSAWLALRPVLRESVESQILEADTSASADQRRPIMFGAGVCSAASGLLMVTLNPLPLWPYALLLVTAGWFLLSLAALPPLLAAVDRLLARTRPGWLASLGVAGVPDQLRTSAQVISAATALLVSLAGGAVNLEASAMPTLEGMQNVDLIVQDAPLNDLATVRSLPASAGSELAALPGVRAAEPIQMGYLDLRGTRVLVQGVAAESRLPIAAQGRRAGHGLDPGSVFASTQVADALGMHPGDTFTLPTLGGQAHEFTIASVVDSFLWPEGVLVMNVADTQLFWGDQTYSAFEVATSDPAATMAALENAPDVLSSPTLVVARGSQAYDSARTVVVNSVQLYQALSAMAFFVAAVIAAGAIALDTSTRLQEYGVVRAAGASPMFLARMVVSRASLLVGCGVAVGWLFGLALQYYLAVTAAKTQNLPITMHWTWGPTLNAVTSGLVILLVSSLGSIWRLRRSSAPELLGSTN